ncbi:3D domain-containing protein [Paraburkholderia sp. CNPSo 3272]|uniref:3D domain-containing protein n=1 Tax=Paraburkholderia sp. CNPSo 3272 TaxID=2940931 RepID=UPI0020B87CAF|nr:3D domain-containing protein [Paraburkholderia sp. CNPSo 3272]MCP3722763.1 3D domain-containing protein [Paraburkholderia sp. CNPSo 3272]
MPDNTNYVTVHDTACTNTNPDSCVVVQIAANLLSWEIPDNKYGDKLPMIPSASRVQHGKILYHVPIKATVKSRGGAPLSGRSLTVKSNRSNDTVRVSGPTDSSGCALVVLESREPGDVTLTVTDGDITAVPLRVTLKEAWYESGFHITHYIIADEHDARGPMVQAPGVCGSHRQDFLYGAGGVPMQGTGETLDGRFVRYDGGGGGWHNNAHGHPDILNNPAQARLSETDAAHGRFGDVVANRSIAVDPTVIPGRSRVYIASSDGGRVVGERSADDTGGGIRGAHIDHFSGPGSAASRTWQASGGRLAKCAG